MAYCLKCGERVADGVRTCPQCGAEISGAAENAEYQYYGNSANAEGRGNTCQDSQDYYYRGAYQQKNYTWGEERFNSEEVRQNKGMGVLSYLGILILIPLLAGNKQSQYVRFHTNQGLVLFITSVIIELLDGKWVFGMHSLINFSGSFLWIFDIVSFALFIMMIMGIVSACKGTKRELPVLGQIKILKQSF